MTRKTKTTSSKTKPADAPMQDEYDFTTGQRGRYAKRFAAGVNLVRVDEDLQAAPGNKAPTPPP